MVIITKNNTAENFVESIGINIKASAFSDGYQNSSLIIRSLNYLGIDKVRDNLVTTGKAAPVLDALANAGIGFDFLVKYGLPAENAAGMAQFIADLKAFQDEHSGSILSIEGLNEPNAFSFSYKGDSSLAGAAAFQKYLYTSIKADSALKDIDVFTFSLAYNHDNIYDSLPDLGNYSDAANVHLYISTSASSDERMEYVMNLASGVSSGDRIIVSEIGHTTLETEPGIGVSEKAQAKIMLSELLLAYENGSRDTYIYELFDKTTTARGEMQRHFGIFEEDGSPKLAAVALHNLTTILTFGDDGTADGVLPTQFSVQSDASKLHAMSLEKSRGVYDIAVWRDVPVWDDAKDVDLANPAVSTTVDLGRVESVVQVYDPMLGLAPIATYRDVRTVTLALRDSPLVIEVGAAAAVSEKTIVSPAKLTMTSAALVEQIDELAFASGLENVTLTDGNVLGVSSTETMLDMIANYSATLAKIVGGFSFSITRSAPGWAIVENFNAKGALTLTTNFTLDGEDVVSKTAYKADGSRDFYRYGIANKFYTTEHQGYDADNRQILLERFHADGSYHLRTEWGSDGSRLYETYDTDGQITLSVFTRADGSRASTAYLQDGTGEVRIEAYNAVGALLTQTFAHPNGDNDVYVFANNQTFRGGAGDDTFYFRTTAGGRMAYVGGDDTVRNFNTDATGVDRIVIGDHWAEKFSDLSLSQQGGDVLIRFDSDEGSILVKQQTVGNLVPDHFVFL